MNQCKQQQVDNTQTTSAKTVQYFISAEEIEWDYSPERDWELEKHHATLEDRCVMGIITG